jgi:hypothetical protein
LAIPRWNRSSAPGSSFKPFGGLSVMAKRHVLYDHAEIDSQTLREEIFKSEEVHAYAMVGFFLSWFGAVELELTSLLRDILEIHDTSSFQVLARGLDPRGKLFRIKQAAKAKALTFEEPLSLRLDHFRNVVLGIRNDLSHHFPDWDREQDRIYFCSPEHPAGHRPPGTRWVSGLDVIARGAWLSLFAVDLVDVRSELLRSRRLGTDEFHAGLPLPPPKGPKRQGPPTKPDTPAQMQNGLQQRRF